MQRLYQSIISKHLKEDRQMLFLLGPRQVGKTTMSKLLGEDKNLYYYNWDNKNHKALIIKGPDAVVQASGHNLLSEKKSLFIFDEIHKFDDWKNFLKGFFDTYEKETSIIVTGSAKLDAFHKSGDSLMGRYFPYRVHPLSINELLFKEARDSEITSPQEIDQNQFDHLWKFGGFPEPFLKANSRFYNRWKRLREKQLLKEDVTDLTKIEYLDKLEILLEFIRDLPGQLISFSSLSKMIGVTDKTIQTWISVLKNLYYCYLVHPWSKNIPRSLIKDPKLFLWDWGLCKTDGARAENFIANHLLKATHYWTDCGFGEYSLYFLRDKEKREVDFLVTKNNIPWMMIEVKKSLNKGISKSLYYYHEKLKTPHTFQVVLDMPFINKDCFDIQKPVIVPAKTLLSQLV